MQDNSLGQPGAIKEKRGLFRKKMNSDSAFLHRRSQHRSKGIDSAAAVISSTLSCSSWVPILKLSKCRNSFLPSQMPFPQRHAFLPIQRQFCK